MSKTYKITSPSKTTEYLDHINVIFYICGFTNFWINPLNWPKYLIKICDKIHICSHFLLSYFVVSIFVSFKTQTNLTPSQETDRNAIGYSNLSQHFYFITLVYYKDEIRDFLYVTLVELKKDHNDLDVEEKLIKKMKFYFNVFSLTGTGLVASRGVVSLICFILYDDPFVPFIAAWPTPDDRSTLAAIVSVFNYCLTWLNLSRAIITYSIVGTLFIVLSHQYMNLQSYFYSLNEIFDNDTLSSVEKEANYEYAFKKGIQIHQITLRCINQCQHMFRWVLNAQMVQSLLNIGLLLPVVRNDGFFGAMSILPMLFPVLFLLGYFMWNAGDITFEASRLPSAVYSSGWQNCHGNTAIVRKLLVNTIAQAQDPVVFKAFNVVELSYTNYVTILKTAYSVVSVFC